MGDEKILVDPTDQSVGCSVLTKDALIDQAQIVIDQICCKEFEWWPLQSLIRRVD